MVELIRPAVPQAHEQPIFELLLYPHRSLSPLAYRLLLTISGTVSLVVSGLFWLVGAWPISGFLGLDMLLLYLAFRSSYRSSEIQETVILGRETLTIKRASTRQPLQNWDFNPYWVRIEPRLHPFFQPGLILRGEGKQLLIGTFLSSNERLWVAEQLSRALREHRHHLSVPAQGPEPTLGNL